MKTNADNRPIIEIGEVNFESEVLKWKQPVLVTFSATWSRPCQVLDSVLEEVAAACAGRVKVARIKCRQPSRSQPDLENSVCSNAAVFRGGRSPRQNCWYG